MWFEKAERVDIKIITLLPSGRRMIFVWLAAAPQLQGRGQRDEDWTDETIVQLRRDGKHAIRDLLGRARIHASLI